MPRRRERPRRRVGWRSVQAILDNAEDCSPEEIAGPDIFPDLDVDVVRRILAHAGMLR